MAPKDILIAARKLIEREESWMQGSFWNDEEKPTRFCADGALVIADGGQHGGFGNEEWHSESYCRAYESLEAQMGESVWDFNDTHTHAEVLAAFDRAIAAA